MKVCCQKNKSKFIKCDLQKFATSKMVLHLLSWQCNQYYTTLMVAILELHTLTVMTKINRLCVSFSFLLCFPFNVFSCLLKIAVPFNVFSCLLKIAVLY